MKQLVIHGGAGSLEGKTTEAQNMHESLCKIWEETFEVLQKRSAEDAVRNAVRMQED